VPYKKKLSTQNPISRKKKKKKAFRNEEKENIEKLYHKQVYSKRMAKQVL